MDAFTRVEGVRQWEDWRAIECLKAIGFSDEEIQEMYDKEQKNKQDLIKI